MVEEEEEEIKENEPKDKLKLKGLPVEITISVVVVDVFGATEDDASKSAADSSESAFTLLRWMDSVRKSIAKNRKPSCALQLRLRRFVFRLLGGPMMCVVVVCALRVLLRFWIFTFIRNFPSFSLNFRTFYFSFLFLLLFWSRCVCVSVFVAATFFTPHSATKTSSYFRFFSSRSRIFSSVFLTTFFSFLSLARSRREKSGRIFVKCVYNAISCSFTERKPAQGPSMIGRLG